MKTPAIIVSDKFLTANFGTKTYMVNQDDPKFDHAIELYKSQSWDALYDHLNEEKKFEPIQEYTQNNIKIVGGEILYKDKLVKNYVVDKIFVFREKGFPYQPIVNFLNNLLETHSANVAKELYLFLEKAGDMPITEDGAFLAYRKVDENYMSYHANPDGTHNRNMVGDVVEDFPFNVDPDRKNTCSTGLHFCSQSYLPYYYGSKGKVMRVKIFPQHVITIPNDYNDAKGRCYKYEVVGECPDLHDIAFKSDLYTSDGQEYEESEESGDSEEVTDWDAFDDSNDTVEEFVLDKIGEVIGSINDHHIFGLDTLLDDIGMDDLDLVELWVFLEKEYGPIVEDGDEQNWKTVQDVVDYIKNKVSSEKEAPKKPKPTLNIDIIQKISNYLERHDGEKVTLRGISKSLKIPGFTVKDVEEYVKHMGYGVEQRIPYNQSEVICID